MTEPTIPMYLPMANNIGFIDARFEQVVAFANDWLVPQGRKPAQEFNGTLGEAMERMYPLSGWRRLLVECKNGQTALFVDSDDIPESPVGHITSGLSCRGVVLTCVEDTYDRETDSGTLGAIQLRFFEPHRTFFLNYGRSISVINEGERWRFDCGGGDPFPFEDVERYKARRVRDRFTREMLVDYLLALGIDAFSRDFYGPRCALFQPP